jgi:phosphosulfolactate phosphohydrolase-like enzyme
MRLLQADAAAHGPSTHAHLVCAATGGEVSQDDCLVAGAIVGQLRDHAWDYASDDSSRLAECLWVDAHSEPAGILHALRNSRGGRNLGRIGLDADIVWSARVDSLATVVGEFDISSGHITSHSDPSQ